MRKMDRASASASHKQPALAIALRRRTDGLDRQAGAHAGVRLRRLPEAAGSARRSFEFDRRRLQQPALPSGACPETRQVRFQADQRGLRVPQRARCYGCPQTLHRKKAAEGHMAAAIGKADAYGVRRLDVFAPHLQLNEIDPLWKGDCFPPDRTGTDSACSVGRHRCYGVRIGRLNNGLWARFD